MSDKCNIFRLTLHYSRVRAPFVLPRPRQITLRGTKEVYDLLEVFLKTERICNTSPDFGRAGMQDALIKVRRDAEGNKI